MLKSKRKEKKKSKRNEEKKNKRKKIKNKKKNKKNKKRSKKRIKCEQPIVREPPTSERVKKATGTSGTRPSDVDRQEWRNSEHALLPHRK